MNYIDADKLKKSVNRYIDWAKAAYNPIEDDADYYRGKIDACEDIQKSINSLQQEQPGLPGIEDPGIPGKDFIPVEWVDACEEYGKWKIVKQDHQEVALEKFTEKIKTFQGRYKHPESIAINGAMAFMARMFYQYPNVARLWYESLPKATMD